MVYRRFFACRPSALKFLFALLIFSISGCGAQTTTNVTGRVTDSAGLAIDAASIVLQPIPSGKAIATTTTSEGKFTVDNVPPGRYSIVAKSTGMVESAREVVLNTEASTNLDFSLSPTSVNQVVEVSESLANISTTGMKTDTPLLETPQSISVISRDRLIMLNPPTLQDAMRYTAGVSTESYGFDSRGDAAIIRGGSWGQYLNGLRMLFGSYNNIRSEPYTLERIDVMRGPSSVLYGQGGFGGVVNLITKKPQPIRRQEVSFQYGTFNRRQAAFDFTGAIDKSEKWLYRLVAVGRLSNTQVDYVPDNRMVLSPAVTWRPATSTTLTILGNLQRDNTGSSVGFFPWQGTIFPAPFGPIPTNLFISEPGFDQYRTNQRSIGYLFEHRFNSSWTVRQNFNYSSSNVNYQSIYTRFAPRPVLNPDGRTLNRTLAISRPSVQTPTIDTHLETKQRTGFLRHTILAGIDFQKSTSNALSRNVNAPAIDIYNPVYGNFAFPSLNRLPTSRQDQTGIYVQDQVKIFEKLVVSGAIRRDWVHAETVGSAASRLDSSATTGRVGLVYLFNNGFAPYVSYSRSFLPLAGVDFFNNPYRPQTAKQIEVGARYETPGKRGMITAAIYDLRDTNRRLPDPSNPLNSIQVGAAQIKGAEFQAQTKLFWRLSTIANYAYTFGRITQGTVADQGKRLATTPLHAGSLWFNRDFRIGRWDGFFAGVGARYNGATFDGADSIRTPVYTLYDAMFSYRPAKQWRLAVNASNLADTKNISTCLARGDCFFGVRRTVIGTVSYQF